MAQQAGLVSAKIASRFTICTAGHQARPTLKTRPTIVMYRGVRSDGGILKHRSKSVFMSFRFT
jgi:hypothetical protein